MAVKSSNDSDFDHRALIKSWALRRNPSIFEYPEMNIPKLEENEYEYPKSIL